MRYKIFLCLSICFVCFLRTTPLFGQDESEKIKSRFFIAPSVNNVSLKDRTFSPIKFSGFVPSIKIGYHQNRKNNSVWGSNLSLLYGTINHSNNFYESDFIAAQFNLYYLRKIGTSSKENIFVGGQFNSTLNLLNFNTFTSGSWFTGQEIEACIRYQHNFSLKHSLHGLLSYSIIGLVATPTYAGIDEFVVINTFNIPKILYSRTEVYSLNKLINPKIELTYFYHLPKMGISVSGNYEYRQINSVRKQFQNLLGIEVGVHFKLGNQKK